MATEAQVADTLRDALARLPVQAVHGCLRELDDLRGQLARATEVSSSTAAADAVGLLNRLDELLNDALRGAEGAGREVDQWAGGAQPSAPSATPSATTPSAASPPDRAARRATDPRPPEQVMTDAINELPDRPNNTGATRGVWIDPHTRTAREVVSGEFDEAEAVAVLERIGIKPAKGSLAITSHVEIKVAAQMHQTPEMREIHLAINNADGPCKGALGCDRITARVLHPGQSLTVYWRNGDTMRQKTFKGKETTT
ncbi:DddA-like double-stranded DNA deaminase toxin [Crossiella sp. NPDC003009]